MLRQAFAAPSRAVRSNLRSIAQRPAFRSQFISSPLSARAVQPALSRRWYSAKSDSAAKDADAAKKEGEAKPEEVPSAEAELKKKLETKEKEALDWKDKYLRSVADFRNLQERTKRDMKNAKDFAITNFAKDLVDSVDNLDRALATVPEEKLTEAEKSEHLQDLVNLYKGIQMTESILLSTLQKHGLERFDPINEKFNPNEHEATFMAPMPDKENNIVFHTQQKGFKLNSRVLRAAKVGVTKNA